MAKENKNTNNQNQTNQQQEKPVNENNVVENETKNNDSNNNETELLKEKIDKLEQELSAKNLKIHNLEKQIHEFNANYKNEIIKKSNEAQIKLEEKIKEYQSKYETELLKSKKYALKDKATELINIINNFDNAVNMPTTNPEVQNYVKGFAMFANMFKTYLENNGIFEIKINPNDEFDPKTMEAFDTEKKDNLKPNHVVKVIKKGYKLHDMVIVPALVVVSK